MHSPDAVRSRSCSSMTCSCAAHAATSAICARSMRQCTRGARIHTQVSRNQEASPNPLGTHHVPSMSQVNSPCAKGQTARPLQESSRAPRNAPHPPASASANSHGCDGRAYHLPPTTCRPTRPPSSACCPQSRCESDGRPAAAPPASRPCRRPQCRRTPQSRCP